MTATLPDQAPRSEPPRWVLGYLAAAALVAGATVIAFVVDNLIRTTNLSLIFVLPVVVAAVSFGWGPALFAAVAGVVLFDLLFVEPRYTLYVARTEDMWALGLLFVIAAIVSTVAAQSRRRAVEAREAADRAEALQALAHVVIQKGSASEVFAAAADTLARLFSAPAVVLLQRDGALSTAARSGGARLSAHDEAAASAALDSGRPTRADAFPEEQAVFDFWPVTPPGQVRFALGVSFGDTDRRPEHPDRLIEVVGAYLAAALNAREA